MEVDVPAPSPQQVQSLQSVEVDPAVTAPEVESEVKVVKKKKKKTSYKSMMASMTKRTKDDNDIEKEKESLRKVTGGGAFTKIDKI